MKKNIKDLFDSFSDETVDIRTTSNISPEKILKITTCKIKENNMNLSKHKKKLSIPIIAAAMVVILSISVFAAHHFLSPQEVATHFNEDKLAEYFSADDTKFNVEPQTSGEYSFQLLGIAAGENLSNFTQVSNDKSYTVGATSKADGTKLTDYPNIMVTPLISGYKPWQVNAFTLGGGRQDFIYEGVNYFIFECDNIEIFADHTVYIAAYEGLAPSAEQFRMEADGTIQFQESYTGIKAMFTVPLDPSKANPEAVKKLLQENELLKDDFGDDTAPSEEDLEIITTETEDGKHIEIREYQ